MKLTEYKNEDAIDVLADMLEPATRILADEEIQNGIKAKKPQLILIKTAMKNHKEEIIEILAIMHGVPKEEYSCNPVTIISDLLELLNDKELVSFFSSQSQS